MGSGSLKTSIYLHEIMRYLVTGAAGFIGSHMADRLIADGHEVVVLDNLCSGFPNQVNKDVAAFYQGDICDMAILKEAMTGCDGVFHFAAIARTPWCIADPGLAIMTNVLGTTCVLETARELGVKRVVLSSSNVVYAAKTPYQASKLCLELIAASYVETYKMSVICLRYSNVYGTRQSELGPSPNVFAALRKAKKELGKLQITGDGEQTRNYTHVSDIVEGNWLAMNSDWCGELDLTTGISTSLNDVAKYFDCPVEYLPERPGDVKHITQSAVPAKQILGWQAKVKLEDGIKDVL